MHSTVKFNSIILHPSRYLILTLMSLSSSSKRCIKYLGILIDSNLTWKYHISCVTSKISKSTMIKTFGFFGFFFFFFLPSSTLLMLYRSLISPYLLNGLTVQGQAPQTYLIIHQILVLQKLYVLSTLHLIDLLLSLFLFPLVASQSIFIHYVLHNLSPCDVSKRFSSANVIHTRFSSAANF